MLRFVCPALKGCTVLLHSESLIKLHSCVFQLPHGFHYTVPQLRVVAFRYSKTTPSYEELCTARLRSMRVGICGEAAANGSEAVQLFPNVLPDVTLMNFQLPEMNELDASRAILREFPDAAGLLFAIHVSEQLKREAHKAGIKGVSPKSEMWHVLDAIDALSQGEDYFRA